MQKAVIELTTSFFIYKYFIKVLTEKVYEAYTKNIKYTKRILDIHGLRKFDLIKKQFCKNEKTKGAK